ncbi:hypothetical protein [Micromonospora chersina]|uniref:hypothetical protein n=1 Tax=Micromonospora chersina TaxID=47854 RepID=UPI0037132819
MTAHVIKRVVMTSHERASVKLVSLPSAAGPALGSTLPGMTGAVAPKAGMTISIRTRRDVVVVDPDRFLTAARQALRDRNPGLTDADAAEAVADVHDAVHALLDRDGALAADAVDGEAVGIGGLLPGTRVSDRLDGLWPAGWLQQVVLDDPQPLQDYGCFLPADPFAVPHTRGG